MTALTFSNLRLPRAGFSRAGNSLTPLQSPQTNKWPIRVDSSIPQEDRGWFNHSCDLSCLPYSLQDQYDRKPLPRDTPVAILENEHLQATFLLAFGGRLWSLIEKENQRNLLYTPKVLQPGNLAVRGAWIPGGIEWNLGVVGHGPFTCEPLFVSTLTHEDGTPGLRFQEWERIRQVPFQIDFHLPKDSGHLLGTVTVQNPRETAVPFYWWTNIAVPETDHTRVVAPADEAFLLNYQEGQRTARLVSAPVVEGVDRSYPVNHPRASDTFFKVKGSPYPWQIALDSRGRGLLHASTRLLKSRKLFCWGQGPGGQRWQQFLSPQTTDRYFEIQGGITWTQAECMDLPGLTTWSWTEAFGPCKLPSDAVHGKWEKARHAAERILADTLPSERLFRWHEEGIEASKRKADSLHQLGSGWGALEKIRCQKAGEPFQIGSTFEFGSDALSELQTPWLTLLKTGAMPEEDPGQCPRSLMVQDSWKALLLESLQKGKSDHWLTYYHLGVMSYSSRDFEAAEAFWERSIQQRENAWAYRNLAVLATQQKNQKAAHTYYSQATALVSRHRDLAVEFGNWLYEHGSRDSILEFLLKLPENLQAHPRIQLLQAKATLLKGDLPLAERQILALEIPDIRENSNLLSELWYFLKEEQARQSGREWSREQEHPPSHLDFRMNAPPRPQEDEAGGIQLPLNRDPNNE